MNQFVGPPLGGLIAGMAIALAFAGSAAAYLAAALVLIMMVGRFKPIDLSLKQRMQLAGTHAANEAAAAVDLVCIAAGSSAARMEYRFERLWRDVKTITTQAFCSPGRYESVGQVMFGVPTDWPFFNL